MQITNIPVTPSSSNELSDMTATPVELNKADDNQDNGLSLAGLLSGDQPGLFSLSSLIGVAAPASDIGASTAFSLLTNGV